VKDALTVKKRGRPFDKTQGREYSPEIIDGI
jgi:hypothetical protein